MKSAEIYPLKLRPVLKAPIWSGGRLSRDWKKSADAVGESWELCVREREVSLIDNGAHEGLGLDEVIARYGKLITGESQNEGRFPLLVKLIDAGDDLSLQVHPDDAYAARVEGDSGKSEMWYVVDADEGARIACGLSKRVSREELERAVDEGRISELLNYIPVKRGECYYIPAGLPHAIGKGVLVAEIQQNCDLTYRLYDYGRGRELHIKKALDTVRYFTKEEIEKLRFSRSESGSDGMLADCAYFRAARQQGEGRVAFEGEMRHLLCIDGEGEILCDGNRYIIKRGDSYLLPAALSTADLAGNPTVLLCAKGS